MTEMSDEDRKLNMDKAYRQWGDLYHFIAGVATVHLLPSGGDYQDQIYVANLGIVLPHLKQPTIVLSKYKSEPRQGEEDIGKDFFKIWNKYHKNKYDIDMAPFFWEGEAETKFLHDNIYAGGYGQRTDRKIYKWFEDNFDMKVIQVEMTDDKLYHFDCMFFPLTKEKSIVCTEIMKPEEIKALEKVTEIIPITNEEAHDGITNCVRVRNMVLMASDLMALKETSKEYKHERATVERLQEICVDEGLCPVVFNMSELEKSGAALSCTCLHLNHESRKRNMIGD
jgi:N-dimethylarginine dimethylaminohydrolase